MKCIKCGATLDEMDLFCINCGTPVQREKINIEQNEKYTDNSLNINKLKTENKNINLDNEVNSSSKRRFQFCQIINNYY